jgi:hypothetical protein
MEGNFPRARHNTSPGPRCRRGQATHTRRSALLSPVDPPHGGRTPGTQPGRRGDPDARAPGRTSTSPGPTRPTVRQRSETTWPSLSPGLRVELTTNSSRRRRPRRPRHLSPPATRCYPTRTGLTQSTCSPGVDSGSFAIRAATTQPGTGPATEFSYPAKRPVLATARQPGRPHQVWRTTTSTSPAHGAHPPMARLGTPWAEPGMPPTPRSAQLRRPTICFPSIILFFCELCLLPRSSELRQRTTLPLSDHPVDPKSSIQISRDLFP